MLIYKIIKTEIIKNENTNLLKKQLKKVIYIQILIL